MPSENKSNKIDPKFKKVLIVDDDESVRDMLSATIKAEGFQVATARDARNIVTKAMEFKPNLIISDVMMPGGGGYELLTMLQTDEFTRLMPVLVVSGANFDPSTKDMLTQQPNVRGFLDKPIHPPQLIQKIHSLLNTKSSDEKFIEDQHQEHDDVDLSRFEDIL